jgi:cardiolipin synthase
MTLANKITVLRIILIPMLVIGLLMGVPVWPLALFILSMITDVLDGLAARLKGERTQLGTFLDPLADKLLLIAVYLTFTYLHKIPLWVFVVVFSRDLMIVLGWSIIYILMKSSAIIPRILGKITTFSQMATILCVMLPAPAWIADIVFWSMITLTIASTIDYVAVGARRLGQFG